MCKGKSLVMTKSYSIYESITSNSHEKIKEENKLKDTDINELLIIELFPIGKHLLSNNRKDWEIIFENKPNWFNEEKIKDKIYDYLFLKVFLRWKNDGMTEGIDLSNRNYKSLPNWDSIKIKELYCSYNQLTSLTVPEGIEKLYCSSNKLTSLTVPEGIQYLDCSNNQLTSLTVPEDCNVDYDPNVKVKRGYYKTRRRK